MLANFVSSSSNMENNSGNSGGASTTIGGNELSANTQQLGGGNLAITSGGDQNGNESKRSQQPPYSMPGVLHYVQHEWSRYELERAQWEMERAELKARISFLIGERKAQENLKHDMVRRIKMLEYALKQERAKFQQYIDNQEKQKLGSEGKDVDEQGEQMPATPGTKSVVPLDIDAILPPQTKTKDGKTAGELSNQEWAKARETLRQYLQEIGYTEKILDVRSFRVKHLMGLLPTNNQSENEGTPTIGGGNISGAGGIERALNESEQAILDAAEAIRKSRTSGATQAQLDSSHAHSQKSPSSNEKRSRAENDEDSDSSSGGDGDAELDAEAIEAFNEFSFLKQAKDGSAKIRSTTPGKYATQPQQKESLDTMKERLWSEQERRRQQSLTQGNKQSSKDDSFSPSPNKARNISVDTVPGIPPNTFQQQPADLIFEEDKFEGTKSGFEEDEDEQAQQMRWNIRYTLRSHYDAIRAMQFHPVEPVLITASEDGTAKLWDLSHSTLASPKSSGDGSGKASQFPQPATGIVDIEPMYTFRGHRGPILTMDMSPLGETCYTAGMDGVICCWNVPTTTGLEIYQNYDRNVLQERLQGHEDAIWSLCFHSASNRLISASADGTIRIWIVGLADGAMPSPLLTTITELDRPRSIDLVSTESHQLLSACGHMQCHIRDLETGQIVIKLQMNDGFSVDDTPPGEINKILSHPTMPLTITAGDDRKIRFFDNNTGKLINSMMAHVEGVSTLAIEPNGLYMLSGSHDGSVRLWNAEKRLCLQEIAAHRKKLGSGVLAVGFHPSRQLIGSSGADSLAKVYGTIRSSPRGSLNASASPPSSSGSSGPSSLVGSPQKHIASSQL